MGIISIGGLNGYFTISEEDVELFFAAAKRGWKGRRETTAIKNEESLTAEVFERFLDKIVEKEKP